LTGEEPRILHAPLNVGGHAYGLSRAERELGLHSGPLVTDAGRRRRAAEKGRRFVEEHHDPRAVARHVPRGCAPALEADSGAVSASASA
jgi:hypothetical protein